MKIANVPKKMSVVFGVNGQRQDLLADSVSGEPNASYNAGFPPITMIAKSAGGQAPLGKDFNQIFNELSADAQWSQASGIYPYDSDFSKAIGGYPKGALVLGEDGITIYQNTIDDNISDISNNSWINIAGDISNLVTVNNLGSENGFSLVGQVDSFASLRLLKPTKEGQRVILSSWNSNVKPYGQSSFGGGEFIAVSGVSADDGGFIAKYSDLWYWQRIKSSTDATILDFGAIPDGLSDSHDAFVNMHKWSISKGDNAPGICAPAGTFYSSPINLTTASISSNNHVFRFYGAPVAHGKHAKTILKSNKSSNPFLTIEAWDVDFNFFIFDGQMARDASGNPSNTQPFYNNIQSGPQNTHINYWYLKNVGGYGFKTSDVLDCKFYESYCTEVFGDLFIMGYDNQSSGSWDHPTATEWSNCNFQDVYPGMVFNAPRMRQGQINNIWITNSNPGNLRDSQLSIINLSIENAVNDSSGNQTYLDLFNSNFVAMVTNSGREFINIGYDTTTAWDTSYQPGQTFIEPFGILTSQGTNVSRLRSSPLLINTNNKSTETWFKIGYIGFGDVGDSVEIKVIGGHGADWDTTAIFPWSTQHGGYTLIRAQRKADGSAQHVNFSNFGGAVTDLRWRGGGGANIEIWLKIATGSKCSLSAETTSPGDIGNYYNNDKYSYTTWIGEVTEESPPSDARTGMSSWVARVGSRTDSSGTKQQGALGVATDGRMIAGWATFGLMSNETKSTSTQDLVIYVDGVPFSITATQITQS